MRCTLLALVLLAVPLHAQLADGDRHYAARATGATGTVPASGPIDAAIGAYQRAVAAAPNDLDAHAKLLRAWRFKGAYVAKDNDEKKKVYGEAKLAGARAMKIASSLLASRGIDAAKEKEKDVAAAGRAIPGLASLYMWDAINWGEWALAYGRLAAAREGAADRIRRQATIAELIDPRLEAGAPSRVLGRLHDQTPRIPFVTGWASGDEALRFLNRSLDIDPSNKLTMLFLAEALADRDAASKKRARELLQKVIASPDHPEYLIEDRTATADARRMMERMK